jgi:SAM-dependent methyltransferase
MRTAAPVTPYDAIRYPGLAIAVTHPDHLAAVALFHGMTPAPPDRCRVLEVGCGDGGNLVPMAYGMPESEFVGIDLAAEAIEAGRAFARRAGTPNVTLETLDLTRLPERAGVFDYIIAHGVYSWVPADVRDALMALVGRHLAPQGVAYVSYNTYPGCHVRQMMWEMLKFHTADLGDANARLTEARALIRLVAHGVAQPDEYTEPVVVEAKRMEERIPALLFHDDLSPVNDPVYFHEFADHAAGHGLQFLAEAAFVSASYAGIAPEARAALATLDSITREQYLDFIKCRRFRRTLLCRGEVTVDREESPERMRPLAFTAARRVQATRQDEQVPGARAEPSAPAASADAQSALMQAVLDVLRAAAPYALPLDALFDRIRARPDSERLLERGDSELQSVALACLQAGVIEPHATAPRLAFPPGNRPTASAVVRAQLADGEFVTSLWHCPIRIDDEIAKRLLPLLDGTRGRRELRAAIADLTGTGAAGDLENHLQRLGRLGLLIA